MADDFRDLITGKIRLPHVEDKLFTEADDWWMNACLDWYHDASELYIVGYKEAADSLVESVNNRNGTADSLVFPIVFLYRQYLELRLKSLLEDGRRLLDKPHEVGAEHRLSKLWQPTREILLEVWPEGNREHLKIVGKLIAEFEKADPRSTSFRYPKDLSGKKSVKLEIPRLNLRNLSEVIGAMAIILEGASAGISEYLSIRQDMDHGW
ncbi:hypothetical protein [Marinospirillum sp.]|uniref:hypothetical protein n=1 Tax=Marinospirillum sp. TaxID=2183934 RepID=UPI00384EDF2C